MKIVIAGIRYDDPEKKIPFQDYAFLNKALANSKFSITEVVCGKAIGVDTLGETWAENNNIPVKDFPANWNKYGKSAGPIRNKEMAEYCDGAVIIWDGKSAGTYNMIQNMVRQKKPYELHITESTLVEFYG